MLARLCTRAKNGGQDCQRRKRRADQTADDRSAKRRGCLLLHRRRVAIGIMPAIIAKLVIKIGLNRLWAASMAAARAVPASRPSPRR